MPFFSVIVPVYQAKAYLKKCIESILHQSFSDFELILVDDGSNDGSEKICDTYAEQEKRIRVIHQKNQGVSSARNAGLDASAGKYIIFADADDWMDTTLFQKCFDVLSENPADVLYHAVKKDIWNKEETKSIIKGLPSISGMVSRKQMKVYMMEMENDMNCTVFSYVIRKSLLEDLRFDIQMPYAEDAVFVMQVLTRAQNYYFLQNCDYHYNARMGSAAYRWQPKIVECYKKNFKKTEHFFHALEMSEPEVDGAMAKSIVNGYAFVIYNLCLPSCTLMFREKMRMLKQTRKDFHVDYYKKYYRPGKKSLFERIKTALTAAHLEIILVIFGPLYCRKH